jgi:hypothetical protein
MSCLNLCSLSGIVSDLALADVTSTGAFVITSNSAERGARAITCHRMVIGVVTGTVKWVRE